jgi:microcystin-dependent protein
MGAPFLGEIRVVSFNFPPKGWAFCDGQTLSIQQNQALFSLMGITYGGNGQTNFQLPNLQGRTPIHTGAGFTQGADAGETTHTLNTQEIPAHSHPVNGFDAPGNSVPASTTVWAQGVVTGQTAHNIYSGTAGASMSSAALVSAGGNQPHENMQPYLVINFVIALQGIFPSRN